MKSVTNLLQDVTLSRLTVVPISAERMDKSKQTATHVNQIFQELLQACPAWNARFEKNPNELANLKRSYLKGLVEENLFDMKQIQFGIRKARAVDSDFFPSVGKFISWCKPTAEELGYPSAREAFARISEFNSGGDMRYNLPPVILATFNQVGHWDLTHLSENKLYPIFESQYLHIIKLAMNGGDINALCPKALPKPENRTKTKEELERNRLNGLSAIQLLKKKHFKRGAHGE
ncbi:replication protein P [Vibrio coralliilyticus]|uniref:replication protein P n=1 Tax=Vibrio coralliilyticus TaxID=190893 RepID=UPI0002EAD1F7|nr:replication protein P [Vibrio coralliilyticus]